MRDGWARVLANLADDFLQGEAAVAPREPKVCGLCDYQSLCRIAESSFVAVTVDEDEVEADD
jgi:hypothetical protein